MTHLALLLDVRFHDGGENSADRLVRLLLLLRGELREEEGEDGEQLALESRVERGGEQGLECVDSQRRDEVCDGRCDQLLSTEEKEFVGVVKDEVGEVSGGAAL